MLCEQVLWIGDGKRKDFPIYSYDESFVPDVNITLEQNGKDLGFQAPF